ncbi:MAG: GspH/FimT family pseudopilin [Gammaproteobacteria bacterium]
MNKLNASGFTLIELMVAVAVLAIALGAGVPSMSEFIQNSRLAAHTNDLLASLHLARTEAIKRNARVTLCPSTNAATCAAPGTGWGMGWMVFADAAPFCVRANPIDPAEVVLDSHGAAAINVSITPRVGDTIGNCVSYTSRGAIRDAAGAAQNGVFRVCDERGLGHARGLVLIPTGRVEFTKAMTDLDPASTGTCP